MDNEHWQMCKYLICQGAPAYPYLVASAMQYDLAEIERLVDECGAYVPSWKINVDTKHWELCQYLVSKGAHPETYFIALVKQNNLPEVIKCVEEYGVDLKERIEWEEDPVSVATENEYWDMCRYLVSQGADAWPYFVASVKQDDLPEVKRLVEEYKLVVKDFPYWDIMWKGGGGDIIMTGQFP